MFFRAKNAFFLRFPSFSRKWHRQFGQARFYCFSFVSRLVYEHLVRLSFSDAHEDARRATDDARRRAADDARRATDDARRRAVDDARRRATDDARRATDDARRRATDDYETLKSDWKFGKRNPETKSGIEIEIEIRNRNRKQKTEYGIRNTEYGIPKVFRSYGLFPLPPGLPPDSKCP